MQMAMNVATKRALCIRVSVLESNPQGRSTYHSIAAKAVTALVTPEMVSKPGQYP